MIKISVYLAVALLGLISIQAYGKNIKVTVDQSTGSFGRGLGSKEYNVDDEEITVRRLALMWMEDMKAPKNIVWDYFRLESHFGKTYKLDETLKDAGVKDGDVLKIKWWNRLVDIGIHGIRGFLHTKNALGGGDSYYHSGGSSGGSYGGSAVGMAAVSSSFR